MNTIDLVSTGSGTCAALIDERVRVGNGAYRVFVGPSVREHAAASKRRIAAAGGLSVEGPSLRRVMQLDDPGSPPRGGVVC
ncbi:MAG: hypothetical protein ACR2F6_05675 [Mycobacteriales bacterium]